MPGNELGPVVIGAREIYDQLVKLTEVVSGLRSELARQGDAQATHKAQLDALKHEMDARMTGYARRLHSVERRVWAWPAASIIVSALAVAVAVIAIV